MTQHRAAFTLVELSVVLAIVALIIGGVLTGKEMLYKAKVNKLGAEAVHLRTAMNQFKDKYGYLPGDFPNATQIWGRADGGSDVIANCTNPNTAPSTSKATCNGDGNGSIRGSSTLAENFRVWQHLSAAEMIAGQYAGTSGTSSNSSHALIGINVPAAALPNGGYFLYSWDNLVGNTSYFDADYKNALVLGANVANSYPFNALLTPADGFAMDTKYDDGIPSTGYIVSRKLANCNTSTTDATAKYNLTYKKAACSFIFKEGFADQK